jgi:hypothetical protein
MREVTNIRASSAEIVARTPAQNGLIYILFFLHKITLSFVPLFNAVAYIK